MIKPLNPQFQILINWIGNDLKELSTRLSYLDPITAQAHFDWPSYKDFIYKEDLIATLNTFTKLYPQTESVCGLLSYKKQQILDPYSIDYFFIQMHIFGHLAYDEIYAEHSYQKVADVGLCEFSTLVFAAMCSHRYFGLRNLTPYMASEIFNVLVDISFLRLRDSYNYSNDEAVDRTEKLIMDLLKRESKLIKS